MDEANEYEQQRLRNIAANRARIAEIGLDETAKSFSQSCASPAKEQRKPRLLGPKRPGAENVEVRRSGRAATREAPVYTENWPKISAQGQGKKRASSVKGVTTQPSKQRRISLGGERVAMGWAEDMGIASEEAQLQAYNAAMGCSKKLNALKRPTSVPKLMTESQVSGGFWSNAPTNWHEKAFPDRGTFYAFVHCDEKWPAFGQGHPDSSAQQNGSGQQSGTSVDERDTSGYDHGLPSSQLWRWPMRVLGDRNGLSGGWRGFAIDHELYPGDCVVFELLDHPQPSEHKPGVTGDRWRAYIFRAYNYDARVRPETAGQAPKEAPKYAICDSQGEASIMARSQEDEARSALENSARKAPQRKGSGGGGGKKKKGQKGKQQKESESEDGDEMEEAMEEETDEVMEDSEDGVQASRRGAQPQQQRNARQKQQRQLQQRKQQTQRRQQQRGRQQRQHQQQEQEQPQRQAQQKKGSRKQQKPQRGGQQQQQQPQKQQRRQQKQQQRQKGAKRGASPPREEEVQEEEFYVKRVRAHKRDIPAGGSEPVDLFFIRWLGYDKPVFDSWEPIDCLDQEPWKYQWAQGALPREWLGKRAAWLRSMPAEEREKFKQEEAVEQALENAEQQAR